MQGKLLQLGQIYLFIFLFICLFVYLFFYFIL